MQNEKSGVDELKHDSGLLGRGQDARSPLSMVNLPVSFFPSAIQFMPQISNAQNLTEQTFRALCT